MNPFEIKQVEVTGYPDFQMFDEYRDVVSTASEDNYRVGYYKALSDMLLAVQREGAYERGYQHGIHAIAMLMATKGRLSEADLRNWIEGMGRRWKDEVPNDIRALPPKLKECFTTWASAAEAK